MKQSVNLTTGLPSSAVEDSLKTSYVMDCVPKLTVDWNLNRYFPPVASNVYNGAVTYSNDHFPIESIVEPLRPTKGICKVILGQSIVSSGYKTAHQPRFYISSKTSKYKYWVSPFRTSLAKQFPTNSNDGNTTTVKPTITYPSVVSANKIVIKIENTWASPDVWRIKLQTSDAGAWNTISTSPALQNDGTVTLYYNGASWSTTKPSSPTLTNIKGIRLEVDSMKEGRLTDGSITSYKDPQQALATTSTATTGANSCFSLIAIEAHREENWTSRLMSFDSSLEEGDTSIIYPIGTLTTNIANVELYNGDNYLNKDNASSPYYGLLKPNVEFNLEYIYTIGATDYSVQGFKLNGGPWTNTDETSVSMRLEDDSKFLKSINPDNTLIMNKSSVEIAWRLLDSIGYNKYDVQLGSSLDEHKIPNFYTDGKKTVWELLDSIAQATQTAFFFDAYGRLQVRTRSAVYADVSPVWEFSGQSTVSKLADIQTIEENDPLGANTFKVTYKPRSWNETIYRSPKLDIVWKPEDTETLRATPLIKSVSPSETYLTMNSVDGGTWPYKGKMLINNEVIGYEGKRYRWFERTVAGNSVSYVENYSIVKSQEEKDAIDRGNVASSTAGTEFLPHEENLAYNPAAHSSGINYEYLDRYAWVGSYLTGQTTPTGRSTVRRITSPASEQTGSGRGIDLYANSESALVVNATSTAQPVNEGDTITISCWVRPSMTANMSIKMGVHNGTTGYPLGANTSSVVSCAANVWTRVSHTWTIPSGAGSYLTAQVSAGGATWPASSTIDFSGLMIQKSAVVGTYIDGTVPGYEWTGTAHASASRKMSNASRVNHFKDPDIEGAISTYGSASPTVTYFSTGGANGGRYGQFSVSGVTSDNGIQPNYEPLMPSTTYTMSVFLRNPGATALNVRLRNSIGGQNITVPANNLWQRYSYTFTTPSTTGAAFLRPLEFYSTGSTSGVIDFDGMMVERATAMNTYFSGDTPGARWFGTADQSASIMGAALTSNSTSKLNSFTGELVITDRGLMDTSVGTHSITPVGYAVKKFTTTTAGTAPAGFSYSASKSTVTIDGTKVTTGTSNTILTAAKTIPGAGLTLKRFGWRFRPVGNPSVQRGGAALFLQNDGDGYFIDVVATNKLNGAARKIRNEVAIYSRKAGKETLLTKGAKAAVASGTYIDIDVSVSISRLNNHTITLWVNGKKKLSVAVPTANKVNPNARFSMFTKRNSTYEYEYVYGTSYANFETPEDTLRDQLDEYSWVDLKGGGVRSGLWVEGVFNQAGIPMFFDEFSPFAHEVRDYEVSLDPAPALSTQIYMTNRANHIVAAKSNPFKADFTLVNASRANTVVSGSDSITYAGSGEDVEQVLVVLGQTLGESDDKIIEKRNDADRQVGGEVLSELTNDWIQTEYMANEISSWLAAHWPKGLDKITIPSFGNPLLDIGDRVSVNYDLLSMQPETHEYVVVSIANSFSAGLESTVTLRRII